MAISRQDLEEAPVTAGESGSTHRGTTPTSASSRWWTRWYDSISTFLKSKMKFWEWSCWQWMRENKVASLLAILLFVSMLSNVRSHLAKRAAEEHWTAAAKEIATVESLKAENQRLTEDYKTVDVKIARGIEAEKRRADDAVKNARSDVEQSFARQREEIAKMRKDLETAESIPPTTSQNIRTQFEWFRKVDPTELKLAVEGGFVRPTRASIVAASKAAGIALKEDDVRVGEVRSNWRKIQEVHNFFTGR